MIGSLIFVGLVIGVLVLCSKLQEARYQLGQERRERAVYERIYNDWVCAGFGQPTGRTPKNYREQPGASDWTQA